MATLKIKGWDTGRNKLEMIKLLKETLGMDEKQTDELIEAIHEGRVISLNFEDAAEAEDFAEGLREVGAKVEVTE
jgi:ribosomal protein L7/L12